MMSTTCWPKSIKWKKYPASFKIPINKKFSTSRTPSTTQSTNGNALVKLMPTTAPFYQWQLMRIFSFLLEQKVSKFGTFKLAKSYLTFQDPIWVDSSSTSWSTQKEDSCSQLVKRISRSGILWRSTLKEPLKDTKTKWELCTSTTTCFSQAERDWPTVVVYWCGIWGTWIPIIRCRTRKGTRISFHL